MPAASELVAGNRTEQEVADFIGADKLIYQDLADLIEAVGAGSEHISCFDTSCFSGEYVTGDITQEYLQSIANSRNDKAKSGQINATPSSVGLHNGD
jgi:amidophosphoribosyltransferase